MGPLWIGRQLDRRWLQGWWLPCLLAVLLSFAAIGACSTSGSVRGITLTLKPWKPGDATISGSVTNPSTDPCSDVGVRVTFKNGAGKTVLTVRDNIAGIGSTSTRNWTLYIGTPHANTEPAGVLAVPAAASSAQVVGRCDDEGPGLP